MGVTAGKERMRAPSGDVNQIYCLVSTGCPLLFYVLHFFLFWQAHTTIG